MMSQITDFYFANHWQISVSQILHIYISQIIHKHRFSVTLSFAPKRSSDRTIAQIADFHFVSFRFASRITVNQNLKYRKKTGSISLPKHWFLTWICFYVTLWLVSRQIWLALWLITFMNWRRIIYMSSCHLRESKKHHYNSRR